MPKFTFLLHATNLLLPATEDSTKVEVGGLYTWQSGDGDSAAVALESAIQSLLVDESFGAEVLNTPLDPPKVVAEEHRELDSDVPIDDAESGFVFYIETDDEKRNA